MNFRNLSIRTKLLGGFALVLLIALVQSLLSMQQLSAVNDKSTEIAGHWLPSVKILDELSADLAEMRLARVLITQIEESSKVASAEQQMNKIQARMDAHMAEYDKLVSSTEDKAMFTALQGQMNAYAALGPQFIKLMRDLNSADAKALAQGDGRKAYEASTELLGKLVELNTRGANDASHAADDLYARARMLLLGGLAAMIVLGMGIGWTVSRDIANAAAAAVAGADRIAEGDLSQSLSVDRHDEMGRLLEALAKMQGNLRQIVAGVRQNAEGVATASAEISQGNHDLSGRTEEQASALEETAASMEELASTVKQNADNARQANQLAMSASTVAVSGGEVVNRVVETMKGINDSSRRIADIIGTIDGIAFQTNILALNAAVEAARAGEQGRGFAVVAAEVRSLAQRSADAAKEIKTLISTSVERVEQGTSLVDQAGTTMQEVVTSIKRVTDIMGEISAASTEQSAGVSQVGEAVTQMDQATQQNAALVEQSAAAAESLKSQAQKLVSAVAVFKLASHDVPRASAPAPAVHPTAAPTSATPAAKATLSVAPKSPVAAAPSPKPAPRAAAPAPVPAPVSAPVPAPAPVAMAATAAAGDDWETF